MCGVKGWWYSTAGGVLDSRRRAVDAMRAPAATDAADAPASSSSSASLRTLDNYEKMDRIGEGTYGVVYKARSLRDDSMVALNEYGWTKTMRAYRARRFAKSRS